MELDWRQLQAFFGRVTPASAQVFVRLPPGSLAPGQRIVGEVSGPHCETTRTLPDSANLRYLGDEPQPLAAAKIADPALWAPAWPVRYRIEVRLEGAGADAASCRRWIGLRHFGAKGRNLVSDGRRLVIRGGRPPGAERDWSEAWRQRLLHLSPPSPGDEALDAAAARGVPLLLWGAPSPGDLLDELSRWAQSAAVWMAVVPAAAAAEFESSAAAAAALRQAAGNVTLACELAPQRPQPPPWAEAVVLPAGDLSRAAAAAAAIDRPVLMHRPLDGPAPDFAALRRGCEQLQRDLAPHGHYAGYLV